MWNLKEWIKDIVAGILLVFLMVVIYFYLIILFPGYY
jgi:hypothetical protein|tara:strand:+ start:972 stop:1082 length:111 start_codon:yes stop_codon:yes gene_type:complete